ncbi:MAG: glycosyltransferase family 4 protein [Flavobacteriales bacterium]|nr:glycosyltransferase family 4 protein [Flavobacteriales bacterium]
MRWAYVYQNELGRRSANLKQTLNTVDRLSTQVDLRFLCSTYESAERSFISKQFGLNVDKTVLPLNVSLRTTNLIAEFRSRYRYNKAVVRELQKQQFDVIYTRDFGFLFYLWLTGQRKNIPGYIVYEPHKVYHRSSSKVMRFMEAGALKQCDAITPITKGLLQDLRSDFSLAQPAHVLPDGVRIVPQAQINKKLHDSPVRFIYAGSFKKWKGLDTLIDAVKILSKDEPELCVTICGGSESEVESMQARCREWSINEFIHWRGYLNDHELQKEYERHHAAILPNTTETISARYTSPLKLFEYLAHGLPIVASDLPSLREVLDDHSALFFTAENPQALAQAMSKIAAQSDLRLAMSERNATFAQQFSWENRAKNLVKFVHEQL